MAKIINFANRFSADVERGRKSTTIRDELTIARLSLGDDLQLFSGLGTARDERHIGDAVLVELEQITMSADFCAVGDNQLTEHQRSALAASELLSYLQGHYKFEGQFHGTFVRWELKANGKRQVAA